MLPSRAEGRIEGALRGLLAVTRVDDPALFKTGSSFVSDALIDSCFPDCSLLFREVDDGGDFRFLDLLGSFGGSSGTITFQGPV